MSAMAASVACSSAAMMATTSVPQRWLGRAQTTASYTPGCEERSFDFFSEDLFAASVDHAGVSAEKINETIGAKQHSITGDGESDAVDDRERGSVLAASPRSPSGTRCVAASHPTSSDPPVSTSVRSSESAHARGSNVNELTGIEGCPEGRNHQRASGNEGGVPLGHCPAACMNGATGMWRMPPPDAATISAIESHSELSGRRPPNSDGNASACRQSTSFGMPVVPSV